MDMEQGLKFIPGNELPGKGTSENSPAIYCRDDFRYKIRVQFFELSSG